MKKIISIAAILCIAFGASAQTSKWKIAVHVDPNVSWLKPDSKHITQGDNVLRYGFGLTLDKMFSTNYAIGTGLNVINTGGNLQYFYKGTKALTNTDFIAQRTRNYSLQYIEIPLTLKLRTDEISYITYWVNFGLGLGFNIRARANDEIVYKQEFNATTGEWKASTDPATISDGDDVKDDISIFRTGLIIAGGIEYRLSEHASVVGGITFNNGFNNVLSNQLVKRNDQGDPDIARNESGALVPSEDRLKAINNLLALNIGILF
ncbi:MAG: porin family protein [Flavobacteriales bacterium]